MRRGLCQTPSYISLLPDVLHATMGLYLYQNITYCWLVGHDSKKHLKVPSIKYKLFQDDSNPRMHEVQ